MLRMKKASRYGESVASTHAHTHLRNPDGQHQLLFSLCDVWQSSLYLPKRTFVVLPLFSEFGFRVGVCGPPPKFRRDLLTLAGVLTKALGRLFFKKRRGSRRGSFFLRVFFISSSPSQWGQRSLPRLLIGRANLLRTLPRRRNCGAK